MEENPAEEEKSGSDADAVEHNGDEVFSESEQSDVSVEPVESEEPEDSDN